MEFSPAVQRAPRLFMALLISSSSAAPEMAGMAASKARADRAIPKAALILAGCGMEVFFVMTGSFIDP